MGCTGRLMHVLNLGNPTSALLLGSFELYVRKPVQRRHGGYIATKQKGLATNLIAANPYELWLPMLGKCENWNVVMFLS